MNALSALRKLPDARHMEPNACRLSVQRLKMECEIRKVSREDLARRAGLSLDTVKAVFQGRRHPSTRTLRLMARALFSPAPALFDAAVIGAAIQGVEMVAAGIKATAPWLKTSEIQIYLAHVELGFDQAVVADALKCSKAWVSLTVRKVEDQRDEQPAFDQAIDTAALLLRLTGGRRNAQ